MYASNVVAEEPATTLTPEMRRSPSEGLNLTENGSDLETFIKRHQLVLRVCNRVVVNRGDRMATSAVSEIRRFPREGQTYYFANFPENGTAAYFRHYNGSDHRVSHKRIPGYDQEVNIGYAWATANPLGTQKIRYTHRPATDDYAIHSPFALIGRSLYPNRHTFTHYAFPRFTGTGVSPLKIDNGVIRVVSNRVAGGAIWEWWWNGKQFINQADYGRLIQSSLGIAGEVALPTEGGNDHNKGSDQSVYGHGSPLVSAKNVDALTQVTRAVPVEWSKYKYPSLNTKKHLVVYKDWQLGKNIRLSPDLSLGAGHSQRRHQIVEYTTVLHLPETVPGNIDWEIPTGYLNTEFNRWFTFDAREPDINRGLKEVTEFMRANPNGLRRMRGCTGLILATEDLKYAMGAYGAHRDDGGDVNNYYFARYGDTHKFALARRLGNRARPGEHTSKTYLMTGTLSNVRVAMRRLHIGGYR
ncbi:hypothetical protein [Gimesia aquarii]|uniref:hypothetical protein n=1 Tax=Gimesia aquarii TaxID=2527964 RepID=UPI0011A4A23F|nr:hypothetical protein [Gimesia aquarii]